MASELEANIVAVERTKEYSESPTEVTLLPTISMHSYSSLYCIPCCCIYIGTCFY